MRRVFLWSKCIQVTKETIGTMQELQCLTLRRQAAICWVKNGNLSSVCNKHCNNRIVGQIFVCGGTNCCNDSFSGFSMGRNIQLKCSHANTNDDNC